MELSAVIFPDTVPSERICIPLVPVFAHLVYLQPVENDPATAQASGTCCEELRREGRVRLQAPAPLAEDRERFLRLVNDIRTRRDDYAAQLGYQTLAGIPSLGRKKTETKSSIVSSLLANLGIKDVDCDRRNLLLWQSRLLLKLAEMHAADQEELQLQLQRIREKEEGLFAGLREEGESPFVLPGELDPHTMNMAALRQQRKAWTRLLVLGEAAAAGARFFISRDRDGMELLAEGYEKMKGLSPVHLGRIALPARWQDQGDVGERVGRFREEGAVFLSRLQAGLVGLGGPDASGPIFAEDRDAWAALLERFFPAGRCGRAELSLSFCAGCTPQRLFAETFAPQEAEFLPEPRAGAGSGVILGILQGD